MIGRWLGPVLALLLVGAVGCGGAVQPQVRYGGNVSLTLVNDADRAACYVRMSPTFDAEWGEDWLGEEEVIPQGAERTFGIAPQSQWDVRIEDCESQTLSERRAIVMTMAARLSIASLTPVTGTAVPGPGNPPGPGPGPEPPPSGAPCNVNGTWTGSGTDHSAIQWQWTLALTQTGNQVEGTIDWRGSSGASGRERVRGTIDCRTHALSVTGYALEQANGLSQNVYVGVFDGAFGALQGTWSGGAGGRFWGTRQ
jgi:hypothetical protein